MKSFTGTATSIQMDKTVVVEVTRQWLHPKYKKTVKRTKKYLVHDEKNQAKVGDVVTFKETKPVSKRKRFILVDVTHTDTLPTPQEVDIVEPELEETAKAEKQEK